MYDAVEVSLFLICESQNEVRSCTYYGSEALCCVWPYIVERFIRIGSGTAGFGRRYPANPSWMFVTQREQHDLLAEFEEFLEVSIARTSTAGIVRWVAWFISPELVLRWAGVRTCFVFIVAFLLSPHPPVFCGDVTFPSLHYVQHIVGFPESPGSFPGAVFTSLSLARPPWQRHRDGQTSTWLSLPYQVFPHGERWECGLG